MSVDRVPTRVQPWDLPMMKPLLEANNTTVNIRITDISEEGYSSLPYISLVDARKALSCKPTGKYRLRIISVFSEGTVLPLDITSSLLEHTFDEYNVHENFANVVASFGQEPDRAEGSSNNAAINLQQSGDGDISYEIRYVEQNQRGGLDPWSLRHTGVFHHHSVASGLDVFIFLHPVRTPTIQSVIATLEGNPDRRRKLCQNPFLLHVWLFAAYFDNWRWYFRCLGSRFAKENNLAMIVEPESAKPISSFLRVQSLRNTNDHILFARACCAGNFDLMSRLSGVPLDMLNDWDELEDCKAKMKAYIESADVLKGRVQNLIDLVGYTLTLHNQLEAAKIDAELRDLTDGLKRLTEDTVDDSATVKIITFVSAVYLPGSFVATLYGMNFFMFNPISKQLEISPDFWIFIATWLPLTLITGAVYILILYLDSKWKGRRFRQPWRMRTRAHSISPTSEKGNEC